MRVLLDECAPRALSIYLVSQGHECRTAQEEGWSGRRNGELLALAAERFGALVKVDAHIQFQQKLASLRIAVVILRAHSNRLDELRPLFPACAAAIEAIAPGEVILVEEGL